MRERFKTSRDRIVAILLVAAVCAALGVAMTFANPFSGINVTNNGSGEDVSVRVEARVDDGPIDNGTVEEPVKVQIGERVTYEFIIENPGDDYYALNDLYFVDTWSSRHNAFGLTDTNDFYAWGDDSRQLGMPGLGVQYDSSRFPNMNPYLSPSSDLCILAEGEHVVDVHTIEYGVMVITNHGNIYSWGSNWIWSGMLGNSDDGTTIFDVPTRAHKLNDLGLETIELSERFGTGIAADKSVYSWGLDLLSAGWSWHLTERVLDPVLIPQLSPTSSENILDVGEYVVEITHGYTMAIARTSQNNYYVITDGSSYFAKMAGVGENGLNGQTVLRHPFLSADSPQFILDEGEYFARVINVSNFWTAGSFIGVTDTGKVYTWGSIHPQHPQSWKDILIDSFVPVRAELWETSISGHVVDIISSAKGSGGNASLTDYVVSSDGTVYEFGYEFNKEAWQSTGFEIDGLRLNEDLSGADKIISFYTNPLVYVLKDGAIYHQGRPLQTQFVLGVYMETYFDELTELPFLRTITGDNFEIRLPSSPNDGVDDKKMYLTGQEWIWGESGPTEVRYSFARLPNGELVFTLHHYAWEPGEFSRSFQLIDHTTGRVYETDTTYHIVEPPEGALTLLFTDADDNPLRAPIVLDTEEHETVDFADYLSVEGFIPGYEYAGYAKLFDDDWFELVFPEGESELPLADLIGLGSITFQFARNDWHEVRILLQDGAGHDIAAPLKQYYPNYGEFALSSVGWLDESSELVATHYSLDEGVNWDPFYGTDVVSIDVTRDMQVIIRFAADEGSWESMEVPLRFELGKILTLTEGTRLGSSSTFDFHFEQVTPGHPAYELWTSQMGGSATAQRADIDSMSYTFNASDTVRVAEHEGAEARYALQMNALNPLVLHDRPLYDAPYVFVAWEEIGDDPEITYTPMSLFLAVNLTDVDGTPTLLPYAESMAVLNGYAPTPQHSLYAADVREELESSEAIGLIGMDLFLNVFPENFYSWLFFINETPGVTDELQNNQLDLTKVLRMNEGTVWDNREDFLFQIEGVATNGNTDIVPPVPADIIPIGMDGAALSTAAGVTTLTKSINLLEGVSFDKPGVYTYRFTEVAGTIETMTYDDTVYEVDVYVRTIDGTPTIESITITLVEGEDRTKVEALEFVNEFYELAEFTITKTVSGDYADPNREFMIRAHLVPTPIWDDYLNDVLEKGQWTWDEGEGVWYLEAMVSHGFEATAGRAYPAGTLMTVTEADYSEDGYTSFINGQQVQSLTIALAADDANLFAIENVYGLQVPTGVWTSSIPWIALVASVVIGAVFVSTRRRQSILDEL